MKTNIPIIRYGTKGILYSDLVGVLIEGMKELQDSLNIQAASFNERIAALESQLALLNSATPQLAPQQGAASVGNTTVQTDTGLFQNTPNPFNEALKLLIVCRKGLPLLPFAFIILMASS